jgi:Amt family ammonium transporter
LANVQINPAIEVAWKVNNQVVSLAGGIGQTLNQLKGVLFTIAFAGFGTFVLLKLVGSFMPLRVTEEEETLGLDLSQHGESAYND